MKFLQQREMWAQALDIVLKLMINISANLNQVELLLLLGQVAQVGFKVLKEQLKVMSKHV